MSHFRDKYEKIAKSVPVTEAMREKLEKEYKYTTKTTGDNLDPYDRSDEPAAPILIERKEQLCYDTDFLYT